MQTQGAHLLMDIWLDHLDDATVVSTLTDYVRGRFRVVSEAGFQFEPMGRTLVLILAESHFSIHTYPEHNYLSLDLYICDPTVCLEKIRDEIVRLLPVARSSSQIIKRGEMIPTVRNDVWDGQRVSS